MSSKTTRLAIEYVAPGDLRPEPVNPRSIAEPLRAALTASLERCAMVELDPRYADVGLARWEHFTGSIATRDGTPTAVAASDADA